MEEQIDRKTVASREITFAEDLESRSSTDIGRESLSGLE
jgi:hypothetical protein